MEQPSLSFNVPFLSLKRPHGIDDVVLKDPAATTGPSPDQNRRGTGRASRGLPAWSAERCPMARFDFAGREQFPRKPADAGNSGAASADSQKNPLDVVVRNRFLVEVSIFRREQAPRYRPPVQPIIACCFNGIANQLNARQRVSLTNCVIARPRTSTL